MICAQGLFCVVLIVFAIHFGELDGYCCTVLLFFDNRNLVRERFSHIMNSNELITKDGLE